MMLAWIAIIARMRWSFVIKGLIASSSGKGKKY